MSRELQEDELLLASGSPRRRRLVIEGGLEPIVAPVFIEEDRRPREGPLAFVARLAEEKAAAAVEEYEEGRVILAADTIVVHDGEILGKPTGPAEARAMLMRLQGQRHEVLTAISLIDRASGAQVTKIGRTTLELRHIEPGEIEAYVDDGSPLDKAGAYGIQDGDFQPVDMARFEGCFTNVMGLPLCLLTPSLSALGWSVASDLTAACFNYVRHELEEASVEA